MISLSQARLFLKTLASNLPGDDKFTFQTFDDKKDRKLKELARILHGTLEDHEEELTEVNELEGGIYVTVALTNLKGRELGNVVQLRAAFIDDDRGILSDDPSSYALEPNIIVRSANGLHVYWLIDRWTDRKIFAPLQLALAGHFNTDPRIKDLTRVMRVPGFNHHKEEPVPVELLHAAPGTPKTATQIIEAFGLVLPDLTPKHERRETPISIRSDHTLEQKVRRCRAFLLEGIGGAVKGSGDGHSDTLGACRAGHDFDLEEADFLPLLMEWGDACFPPWEHHALEREYYSVVRSSGGMAYPRGNKLGDPSYQRDGVRRHGGRESFVDASVPWADAEPGSEARVGELGTGPETPHLDRGEPWATTPDNPGRSRVLEAETFAADGGGDGGGGGDGDDPPDGDDGDFDGGGDGGGGPRRIGKPIEEIIAQKNPSHRSDVGGKVNPRMAAWHMLKEYNFLHDEAGNLYVYTGSYWMTISDSLGEKIAMQYFPFEKYKPSMAKDAVTCVKQVVTQKDIPWNNLEIYQLPLKGGILDIRTMKQEEHRPEHYLDRVIPYDYEPEAECPRWTKALDEWLPGQEDEKTAIQQFLGYILMPRALYKKALILFGDSDTGKSQVCAVARELAGGPRYVCGILPSEMDDPQKRASIKGMALNLIPDLPKKESIEDGGFKMLVSTGEAITLNQKYKNLETYLPNAKHVFATNNLPYVYDNTKGVFRRLMIIKFDSTIALEDQDPELFDKLKMELSGILSWAIDGARELFENRGVWHEVLSSEELVKNYRNDQNPCHEFIEECPKITKDPDGWISAKDFRDLFQEYYAKTSWGKYNPSVLGKKMMSLGYETTKRQDGSSRLRGYQGIRETGAVQLSVLDGGKIDEKAIKPSDFPSE